MLCVCHILRQVMPLLIYILIYAWQTTEHTCTYTQNWRGWTHVPEICFTNCIICSTCMYVRHVLFSEIWMFRHSYTWLTNSIFISNMHHLDFIQGESTLYLPSILVDMVKSNPCLRKHAGNAALNRALYTENIFPTLIIWLYICSLSIWTSYQWRWLPKGYWCDYTV